MSKKLGIIPVETKVLIQPEKVEDRSAGGLWIPEHRLEREQWAQDRGTLIAKGGLAFEDWEGRKPEIGEKVIYRKYAGTLIKRRLETGVEEYRLCQDEDIIAILDENEQVKTVEV